MIIVGLTGSIGMGKSTTASMFADEGIPVHDADAVVHRLYEGEAVTLVEAEFPGTTEAGKIQRAELGKKVIGNADAMQRLESIIHPLVHQEERAFLENAQANNADIVVLDIPLLLETGGDKRVDVVVVVTASPEEQRKRVLAREGMNEEKFNAILAQQMPDGDKRKRADFIVDTSDGLEPARKQVRIIIDKLRAGNTTD